MFNNLYTYINWLKRDKDQDRFAHAFTYVKYIVMCLKVVSYLCRVL